MTFDELPCRWRRAPVSDGRRKCVSAKVYAPRGVTVAECSGCYLRDHDPVRSDGKPRTDKGKRK